MSAQDNGGEVVASLDNATKLDLSIVIPVFNEEGSVEELFERLVKALDERGYTYEILFIEDGSTDDSFQILSRFHEDNDSVRVIQFVRNFGQQMAISAGFTYARGEAIVLLDADLQTPPEEIPTLVSKLDEGFDIVYGVREYRIDSLLRRVGSWMMSHLLYRFTGIDVPDSASGFIALKRSFVNSINLYNEKSRYLSGLLAWLSYGRVGAVPVAHVARAKGESKYSTAQLVALTLNFVCGFSVAPLRLAFYVGVPVSLVSVVAIVALSLMAIVSGLATIDPVWFLAAAVFFLGGVQLLAIGILGEYLGRVYSEVRERPNFVVRQVLDHESGKKLRPAQTDSPE